MICPNCSSAKSRVIDTGREGEVILRRRECKECSERFNTCEAVTHVKGSRLKTPESVMRMRLAGNSVAASKAAPKLKLISVVESQRRRAIQAKRRRDAEDMEEHYSDEYVDSQVGDDEVQDLVDMFKEYE